MATNKTMHAWTRDAAGISVGTQDTPYMTGQLRRYIRDSVGSSYRVLVAPKGYGKTLFLKYKSHIVRTQQASGIAIYPDSHQDIEYLKLTASPREMQNEVARLSIDIWASLWQFVLIGKALQIIDAIPETDKYLTSFFSEISAPVGELLTAAIRDADSLATNVSSRLALLRRQLHDEGKDVIIFIENADEMFVGLDAVDLHKARIDDSQSRRGKSPGEPRYAENQREADAAASNENARTNPSMWKSAQVGLLLAIREIERSAGRLCVYTTLRAEAINGSEHKDIAQAMSYVVSIRYSLEDLREIFGWHVARMDESDLVSPAASDPVDQFLGASPVLHRYVNDSNGRIASEKAFNLIVRHTTYSPRELVVVGWYLSNLGVQQRSGPDRDNNIRSAVDAAASELMTYFRLNVVPAWKDEWTLGLSDCSSPVFDNNEVKRVFGADASRLYAFGLLGYSQLTGEESCFRQNFITTWDDGYASLDRPLPNATYYFLHPWLHDSAKKHCTKFNPDRFNIIGSGCIYTLPPMCISLRLGRDPNGAPAILLPKGRFDSPTASSRRLNQDPAFFFVYVLACSIKRSRDIYETDLEAAKLLFDEKFPEFARSEMLRPFEDTYHASHMNSNLVDCFPELAKAIMPVNGKYGVQQLQDGKPPFVRATFLDVTQLTIDC